MAIIEYSFDGTFNLDILDTELRTAYGVLVYGVKSGVGAIGAVILIDDSIAKEIVQTEVIDLHNPNDKTTEKQIEIDKTSILALATTAKNFTPEIKAIWSAIVNADYNADDTTTRFTAIRAAVAAQGNGFKNVLHTALESETGLTTLVLDATPTDTEKQAYNQWIRSFCLTWAFMIVLA